MKLELQAEQQLTVDDEEQRNRSTRTSWTYSRRNRGANLWVDLQCIVPRVWHVLAKGSEYDLEVGAGSQIIYNR